MKMLCCDHVNCHYGGGLVRYCFIAHCTGVEAGSMGWFVTDMDRICKIHNFITINIGGQCECSSIVSGLPT